MYMYDSIFFFTFNKKKKIKKLKKRCAGFQGLQKNTSNHQFTRWY